MLFIVVLGTIVPRHQVRTNRWLLAILSTPIRRLKVMSGVVVLVIALIGYGIDEQNARFLTCDGSRVSGNDIPTDCFGDRVG